MDILSAISPTKLSDTIAVSQALAFPSKARVGGRSQPFS